MGRNAHSWALQHAGWISTITTSSLALFQPGSLRQPRVSAFFLLTLYHKVPHGDEQERQKIHQPRSSDFWKVGQLGPSHPPRCNDSICHIDVHHF